MRTCTCPVGTYLTTIGTNTCPTSFGQVQKLIFQRSGQAAGLGSTTTIKLLATWTALLASTSSTKVVVTPFIAGFTPDPGKVREFGSGNEVRDGIPINFGTGPTKYTLKLYEPATSIVTNLKALECESLEVTLVNELGYYGHGGTAGVVKGFTVQQFHVSDRVLGGFDGPDYVEISFSMPPNWSSAFTITAPTDHSGLDHNG